MSWPADGLPRFKPASIARGETRDDEPAALGYVYDRAYCHLPVVQVNAQTPAIAQERAELEAAILKVGPTHPEAVRRATHKHGVRGYRNIGCKCPTCSRAAQASDRVRAQRKRAAAR